MSKLKLLVTVIVMVLIGTTFFVWNHSKHAEINVTNYKSLVKNNDWTDAFNQAKIDAGVNGRVYVPDGNYIIGTFNLDVEGQEWNFDKNSMVTLKDDSTYWFNTCNILFNVKASKVSIKGLRANGNSFRQKTSTNKIGSTTNGSDIISVDNTTGLWKGLWIKIDGINEILMIKNINSNNKQIQVDKPVSTTLTNKTVRLITQVKGIYISKSSTGKVSNVVISDFYLDGCGIHGVECDDVKVSNGQVINTFDSAIQFSGNYRSSDWYNSTESCNRIIIDNVNVRNHKWAGVFFQMCHNSVCSNSIAKDCEDMGFDFEFAGDSKYINCIAENCLNGFTMMNPNIGCSIVSCIAKNNVYHGIRLVNGTKGHNVSDCQSINNGGYGVELENYDDSILKNCVIKENKLGGIYMGNSHRSIISDCIIKDNKSNGMFLISSSENRYEKLTISGNGANGINISSNGSSHFLKNTFINCNIDNNVGTGLSLPSMESTDCDIVGCTFTNHRNKAAIEMNYVQRITIKNCIFNDNLYGIYSSTRIDNCSISNNKFHGNKTNMSFESRKTQISDNNEQ